MDKINFKTIGNFNHNNNKIRTLKKYNSFKGFNKGKIHILNKKPIELNNELFVEEIPENVIIKYIEN